MPDSTIDTDANITYQDMLRTGPGTIGGRYLRHFWHPVGLASDIAPGTAKPVKLMSEEFTLYRGATGAIHLLQNRCAHRGVQLSVGWVEGDAIRCIYHGWKFDASGQCVDQPAEPKPFCERIKVQAYPVREYLGMIFAYIGEGTPPELQRLPEYEEETGYYRLFRADQWPCNYFLQLENSMDYAHVAILHWHFHAHVPQGATAAETDYGIELRTPGIRGQTSPHEQSHFMFPTAHEWSNPGRRGETVGNYARGWRVPIDDNTHMRINLNVFPVKGEEGEAYRERLETAEEKMRAEVGWHWENKPIPEFAKEMLAGREQFAILKTKQLFGEYMTDIQDCTAMVGQGDVATRDLDEHLGFTDHSISLLRRLYRRELAALASGQPIKEWRRPDELYAFMKS